MPAYSRGNTSLESYLVKILAAICRDRGGEIRIRGSLVDQINQPVTLLKDWDSNTQELVLRTHMGEFGEVFRAIPERQPTQEVIAAADPIAREESSKQGTAAPPRSVSTDDDERLSRMEQMARRVRIAREIRTELRSRQREEQANV